MFIATVHAVTVLLSELTFTGTVTSTIARIYHAPPAAAAGGAAGTVHAAAGSPPSLWDPESRRSPSSTAMIVDS